jgi:hypothetical protein
VSEKEVAVAFVGDEIAAAFAGDALDPNAGVLAEIADAVAGAIEALEERFNRA